MAQEMPWSSISPTRFLRDVATQGEVTLTVAPRPDVATGLWWQIVWTGEDGAVRSVAAQDLALLMRRAAARELAAREAWEAGPGRQDAPQRP
jgi:cell wall assembly regulator SMI1